MAAGAGAGAGAGAADDDCDEDGCKCCGGRPLVLLVVLDQSKDDEDERFSSLPLLLRNIDDSGCGAVLCYCLRVPVGIKAVPVSYLLVKLLFVLFRLFAFVLLADDVVLAWSSLPFEKPEVLRRGSTDSQRQDMDRHNRASGH